MIYQITNGDYSDYGVVALLEGPDGLESSIRTWYDEYVKNHPYTKWLEEVHKEQERFQQLHYTEFQNNRNVFYSKYNDYMKQYYDKHQWPTIYDTREFVDTVLKDKGIKFVEYTEVHID